ncbi:hypothetical protein ZWY2020_011366 [Hordeum vulgare]|nr:hypothetical protein ZWY2020_011366 [Hordeum vulgare]
MPHPSNFHPPRQGQSSMENFHFVGVPPQFGSFSTPPPPPHTKAIPSSSQPASAKVAPSSRGSLKKKKLVVNLEDDSDPARTAQRLAWTSDEETRLAGTWLENSTDPIDGNNKKNEKYWDDIAADYNSITSSDPKRDAQQLKQHFHKVKTKINAFHGE